jgi:peptide/nickel transport system substrate-binding protein
VPEFDPGAAVKLLDAAGWKDTDKDGIRDKDGKQLHLVMIGSERPAPKDSSAPPVKLPRDYFIEAARRIGVVIEVKTGGESWVAKHVAEGSYDLVEMQWSGMVDMDLSPLLGGKNPQRASSPKIERTLDAMAAAWDPAERGKLAVDLAAALAETWTLTGIVAEAPQGLVHRRVRNTRVWDGWIDIPALSLDDR